MHSPREYAANVLAPKLRRVFLLAAVAAVSGQLTACRDYGEDQFGRVDAREFTGSLTIQDPGDGKFKASDEPYRLGVEQFDRGFYGNAQKYFQEAVEKSPRDVDAWLALAACYDQIRRFDLADKAYDRAIALNGRTSQLLNNLGYSFVLRGDLSKARQMFAQALQRDPDNVTLQNNLRRLDASAASARARR